MNALLVFVAAVAVALVLGRQEARHELSLRLRAHRTGLVPPARRVPVPFLEALVALVLGLTLLLGGGAMAARLSGWGEGYGPAFLQNAAALVLAAGVSLVVLAVSALRRFAR